MTTTGEQVAQQPGQAVTKPAADPFRFGWRYVWQKDARGQMVPVQVPLQYEDVLYPQEEDFIVQNDAHDRDCVYLRGALRVALRDRPTYKVLHDHRIDWGKGGVKPLGPDLAVLADVTQPWDPHRGTFPVAEMGATPVLVIEVTSPTTRSFDLIDKVVLYHRAGVPFYAIVDYRPELVERQVHVFAYRATPEGYVRVDPDAEGRVWLEGVNLWLTAEGDRAVCFTEHGERMPDIVDAVEAIQGLQTRTEEMQTLTEEAITARQEAEKQAKEEARQREEAEKRASDLASRNAELEAELRRLRGEG
jgi:Uma2 family endonuclease